MRPLLAISACLLFCGTAEAQWFPNAFWNKQVESAACPGGVCPTSNNWTNRDGLSRRAHTEHVHGVNTAGMSEADIQQHQNDYHNTYGAGHPVRGALKVIVSVPRAGARAVVRAATYPARSGYNSGGSVGQTASYGSVGSPASYGSVGSLVVGQPDDQGYIVTSIGPQVETRVVTTAATCPCNCPSCNCPKAAEATVTANASPARIGDRAKLMRVMLAAAREARGTSVMDVETVARMRAAMVDAALVELAASEQAIDIDKWIAIIEKLIPLILKLIDLFGQVSPATILDMQYAYDDSSLFHLAI